MATDTQSDRTGRIRELNDLGKSDRRQFQTGRIVHGDCIEHMRAMQSRTVDFILTDPPYVTRYCSRDGRTIANDDNADWLRPAFAQMYRVLRYRSFCVSF